MKKLHSWMTALTAVLLFSCVAFAESKDASWPAFNGVNHDNISPDKGLLKSWPEDGPKQLWSYDKCGKGYVGVTVADGMVFTAGDLAGKNTITALDLSGKMLWQAENGKSWTGSYPGQRSSPVYSDGMVYQINVIGILTAFDAKTGKEAWSFNFKGPETKGAAGSWGFAESVTIDGNNLICMPGGKNVLCVALDKKTGKKVWASESTGDNASYCSGILVEHKGKKVLLTMSAKYAVGIDPKTGKLLFKFAYETPYDVHATTPVYLDGYVYITSGYGTEDKCFKLNDALSSATEVWSEKNIDNHHGGVVMLDGYIYGIGDKYKGLSCVEMKTGKKVWNEKSVSKGSITYADGMLYCLSEKGNVTLAAASSKGFQGSGKFKFNSAGKDPFWNHPVVVGGKLFLRHENDLMVFDVKNK